MIEDEKLGLKIAENADEAYWEEIRKATEEDINRLTRLLRFQNAILEMVNGKLRDAVKQDN